MNPISRLLFGGDILNIINKIEYDAQNFIENAVRIENGNYIHTQIEKREGLVFMRTKTRKLFELATV